MHNKLSKSGRTSNQVLGPTVIEYSIISYYSWPKTLCSPPTSHDNESMFFELIVFIKIGVLITEDNVIRPLGLLINHIFLFTSAGLSDLAKILIGLGAALVLILGFVGIVTGVICWRRALFNSHRAKVPRRGMMRPVQPMPRPRSGYYNRNIRR